MGRIIEERPSFTERLSNVMGIAEKGVGIAKGIQDISQAPQRFKIEQDRAAAQMEAFSFERDQKLQEMEIKKEENKRKSAGFFLGQITNMVDLYGDIEDPKERESLYTDYLKTNGSMLMNAAKGAELGLEDPAKFDGFVKNKAAKIAPLVVSLRSSEEALLGNISTPDKLWKPEEAATKLTEYTRAVRRLGGVMSPEASKVLETNLDDMRKQIDAKNARIANAANQRQNINIRTGGDMAPALKGFETEGGKAFAKEVTLLPQNEARLSNIEQLIPLLDRVGTGPIKGQPAVYFAQKLGNEDAQRLQSYISKEGIESVITMAKEAGARAIDSDAERKYLIDSLANIQQNPGVIRDILARQQKLIQYTNARIQAKQEHLASGGRLVDFKFQGLKDFMKGPQSPSAPAQVSQTPAAPSGSSRNKFLME